MRSPRTRFFARAAIAIVAIGAGIALTSVRAPSVAAERTDTETVSQACAVLRTADASRVLELALDGTTLMPAARGKVRIERERKARILELKIEADRLPPADSLGREFLTYVAWTVDGSGTVRSIGELRRDSGGDARLEADVTETDHFGLLVTAEPHFAISSPSELIVLRTRPANKAARRTEWTDASCSLVARDRYRLGRTDEELELTLGTTTKRPVPDLVQALNAIEIARLSRAEEFAPTRLAEARRSVIDAQKILRQRDDRKKASQLARDAVIAAESARRDTITRASARSELTGELERARAALSEREARIAELERDLERRAAAPRRRPAEGPAPVVPAAPVAPIIVQVPAAPAAPVPQSAPSGAAASPDTARLDEERMRLSEERARLARERQEMELAKSASAMREELAQEIRTTLVAERDAFAKDREALIAQRRAVEEQIAALAEERAKLQTEREAGARVTEEQLAALSAERTRLESERSALAADIGQPAAPNTMSDAAAPAVPGPVATRSAPPMPSPGDADAAALAVERAEFERMTRELEQKQRALEMERMRLEAERARAQADRALAAPAPPPAAVVAPAPSPARSGVTVVEVPQDEPQTTVVIEEPRKRRVWPFRRKAEPADEAEPVVIEQAAPSEGVEPVAPKPKRRWWRFGRSSSVETAPESGASGSATVAEEPQPKKKRGIWPFNRKKTSETAAPAEPTAEDVAAQAADEPEPKKKRGIWPFNRKKKSDTTEEEASPSPAAGAAFEVPDDESGASASSTTTGTPAATTAAAAPEFVATVSSRGATHTDTAPVMVATAASEPAPHEARLVELRTQTELLAAERARLEAERLSLERAHAAQQQTPARAVEPVPASPAWRERVRSQFAVIDSGGPELTVRLGELSFASGSATLQTGAREELARLAGAVADVAHEIEIVVEGHTDDTGGDAANLRLSQRRADAVVAFLVAKGIDPGRLVARGFGESRPVASNQTPEGRRENRRVEIVISDSVKL